MHLVEARIVNRSVKLIIGGYYWSSFTSALHAIELVCRNIGNNHPRRYANRSRARGAARLVVKRSSDERWKSLLGEKRETQRRERRRLPVSSPAAELRISYASSVVSWSRYPTINRQRGTKVFPLSINLIRPNSEILPTLDGEPACKICSVSPLVAYRLSVVCLMKIVRICFVLHNNSRGWLLTEPTELSTN